MKNYLLSTVILKYVKLSVRMFVLYLSVVRFPCYYKAIRDLSASWIIFQWCEIKGMDLSLSNCLSFYSCICGCVSYFSYSKIVFKTASDQYMCSFWFMKFLKKYGNAVQLLEFHPLDLFKSCLSSTSEIVSQNFVVNKWHLKRLISA